jgi:TonB family protein
MIMRGEESDVKVRLLVDASGKVTKCTSLSHFKEPEFGQIVCAAITKRAKLEPAELADGTKVPSYYTTRIDFRMAD